MNNYFYEDSDDLTDEDSLNHKEDSDNDDMDFDLDEDPETSGDEDSFDDTSDDSDEESEDDIMNQELPEEKEVNQEQLVDELNKIFTPVLIMQNYETDKSDQIKEALSEASLLTEKNIIQFDNETKMAQLIATCALLIARAKNTPDYQKFIQASRDKKQAKIDIQTAEYNDAKDLAQKYLVNVSTKNGSAVARRLATELLPESN